MDRPGHAQGRPRRHHGSGTGQACTPDAHPKHPRGCVCQSRAVRLDSSRGAQIGQGAALTAVVMPMQGPLCPVSIRPSGCGVLHEGPRRHSCRPSVRTLRVGAALIGQVCHAAGNPRRGPFSAHILAKSADCIRRGERRLGKRLQPALGSFPEVGCGAGLPARRSANGNLVGRRCPAGATIH